MEHLDNNEQEKKLENLLQHIESEIKHEESEIHHLEEDLKHEKENVEYLKKEVEEIEQEIKHHHEGTQKLVFVVNGGPVELRVEKDWPLQKAVEVALKETGNEGRKITDWQVKWHNQVLDMQKTIKALCLPDCAELFVSLNAGHGGDASIKVQKLCK